MSRTRVSPVPVHLWLLLALAVPTPLRAQAAGPTPPLPRTTLSPGRSQPVNSLLPNLVVNGDFENFLTIPGCWYNQTNTELTNALPGVTAYGGAEEIDLMIGPGDCIGGAAQSGISKLALHRQVTGIVDEISFQLSSPVVAGTYYELSCWAFRNAIFDPGDAPLEIGLSASPTDFGTLVYSSAPNLDVWTLLTHTFAAPVNAGYLTVRVGFPVATWLHVDNFSLVNASPVPVRGASWARVKALYR